MFTRIRQITFAAPERYSTVAVRASTRTTEPDEISRGPSIFTSCTSASTGFFGVLPRKSLCHRRTSASFIQYPGGHSLSATRFARAASMDSPSSSTMSPQRVQCPSASSRRCRARSLRDLTAPTSPRTSPAGAAPPAAS
jgi:hypothetical protein